ncbi:putative leucine-rich repeat receptor-like protein kinase [Quercus suber]|uniref:non-specific serine/threonine protein kinase n=1 Tax=Quercus suber TaxID=58331 RepID=A0AAW0KD12_QUESU
MRSTALEKVDLELLTEQHCQQVILLLLKGNMLDSTDIPAANHQSFGTEIRVLTEVRHRNIIKLCGFCSMRGYMYLVYEYVERGKFALTMQLTNNCDVYSFGVVALEVIMGRHPRELLSSLSFKSRTVTSISDGCARPRTSPPTGPIAEEVVFLVTIALARVRDSPEARPTCVLWHKNYQLKSKLANATN